MGERCALCMTNYVAGSDTGFGRPFFATSCAFALMADREGAPIIEFDEASPEHVSAPDSNKPRRRDDLENLRDGGTDDWSHMKNDNPSADSSDTQPEVSDGSAKSTIFTAEEARQGAELASTGYVWITENQPAFCAVAADIKRDARAGRRASPYRAVENMRAKEFTDAHGHTTRTPNAIVPVLARIVVLDHPECAPFVRMSRSVVDAVELRSAVSCLDGRYRDEYLA